MFFIGEFHQTIFGVSQLCIWISQADPLPTNFFNGNWLRTFRLWFRRQHRQLWLVLRLRDASRLGLALSSFDWVISSQFD